MEHINPKRGRCGHALAKEGGGQMDSECEGVAPANTLFLFTAPPCHVSSSFPPPHHLHLPKKTCTLSLLFLSLSLLFYLLSTLLFFFQILERERELPRERKEMERGGGFHGYHRLPIHPTSGTIYNLLYKYIYKYIMFLLLYWGSFFSCNCIGLLMSLLYSFQEILNN